eukprot:gene20943-biopygen17619
MRLEATLFGAPTRPLYVVGWAPSYTAPKPYAWRRRSCPDNCLGVGPQAYVPAPVARARNHTPGGDDPCPLYGPICLGLGPQLYVPAPWPIG